MQNLGIFEDIAKLSTAKINANHTIQSNGTILLSFKKKKKILNLWTFLFQDKS